MFDEAKKIIFAWDPIGLAIHQQWDEYDFEIIKIVKILEKTSDLKELTDGIIEVFVHAFGDDIFTSSPEECKEIARKLLAIPR